METIELSAANDARVAVDELTFIGNATLLLRLNGITLVTDPNFLHAGDHAHLGYGLRSRRLHDPAVELRELPPIDAVVLSHYHGDHFDHIVERELDRSLPIFTTAHARKALAAKGFRAVRALRHWEAVTIRKGARDITLTALPGRHGPAGVSRLLPPVNGSLIDIARPGGTRFRLYISGDTLMFDGLRAIARRVTDIDVALLHLGGTRIAGILVTLDGRGGAAVMRLLDADVTIPIHYEEYTVMTSPLADFLAAAKDLGLDSRVRRLERGETYRLPS